MADGHLGKCKACACAYSKEHRVANPDYYKKFEGERSKTPERIALNRRVFAEYVAQHPDRRKANNAVASALRTGKLTRQPCWVCGKKAVAHHPDYDRPLDVVWLCQAHHKQAHALI